MLYLLAILVIAINLVSLFYVAIGRGDLWWKIGWMIVVVALPGLGFLAYMLANLLRGQPPLRSLQFEY